MTPFTPSPYLTEKPIDNKNAADARMRSVSGADQAPGRWMKPPNSKKVGEKPRKQHITHFLFDRRQ